MKKVKHNNIYVFLKNKLIATETILPILFGLPDYHLNRIFFYTDHKLTFDYLKNDNLIYNAINHLGSLNLIGNNNNLFVRKIKIIFFLFNLILKIIFFKKLKFIHSGKLNIFPFNLLYYLNSSNTYYFESSASGLTSINTIFNKKRNYSENKIDILAKKIFYFNINTPYEKIKDPDKYILLENTLNISNWINFIDVQKNINIKNHTINFIKNNKTRVIIFFISPFDVEYFLNKNNSMINLFHSTIKNIRKITNIPVIIKFKDKAYDSIVKSECSKINYNDIYTTHLHASVFYQNAVCFISNTPSNAFFIGRSLSVPTIEYTDYSNDYLKITKNQSAYSKYVDYFINYNQNEFQNVLNKCIYDKNKKEIETTYLRKELLLEFKNDY